MSESSPRILAMTEGSSSPLRESPRQNKRPKPTTPRTPRSTPSSPLIRVSSMSEDEEEEKKLSPRVNNLRKFEDLLSSLQKPGEEEEEKTSEEARPRRKNILKESHSHRKPFALAAAPRPVSKMNDDSASAPTQPRARARNFTQVTGQSASVASADIRKNYVPKRTINFQDDPDDTPDSLISPPLVRKEGGSRVGSSGSRFGLRNLLRSPRIRPSKPKDEPLGKEIWGARIIEEGLSNSQPIEHVLDYEPQIVKTAFGWVLERPAKSENPVMDNATVEFLQFESVYYISHFYEKDHYNFFATEKTLGNTLVSVRKDKMAGVARVLIRTKKGITKMEVNLGAIKKPSSKTIVRDMAYNEGHFPNLTLNNIRLVDTVGLQDRLVKFERADVFKRYKFGVLLVKEGQTRDDEFFANVSGSARYEEFLDVLGDRIELKGWNRYAGGLDVEGGSTGEHSVYRHYVTEDDRKYEIMFHVSTLLPFYEDDTQHVERKRHLGNDVVNIVFNDSGVPFDPASVVTNFIHSYIVVSVDAGETKKRGETAYRVEIVSQTQVPPFNPPLRHPPVYTKSDLQMWMPPKLINAERAAFLAPAIRYKLTGTRKQLLDDIFSDFG